MITVAKTTTDDFKRHFAHRLRVAIAVADMTPNALSEMTGINNTSIYDWIHGEHTPNAHRLAQICVALNVDANKLLGIRRGDAE